MNTISFHDTHVYPGCLATILAVPAGVTPGTAEFSDGSMVAVTLERLDREEVIVRVDAYTTARGTRIPSKDWRLVYDDGRDLWKVAAKV